MDLNHQSCEDVSLHTSHYMAATSSKTNLPYFIPNPDTQNYSTFWNPSSITCISDNSSNVNIDCFNNQLHGSTTFSNSSISSSSFPLDIDNESLFVEAYNESSIDNEVFSDNLFTDSNSFIADDSNLEINTSLSETEVISSENKSLYNDNQCDIEREENIRRWIEYLKDDSLECPSIKQYDDHEQRRSYKASPKNSNVVHFNKLNYRLKRNRASQLSHRKHKEKVDQDKKEAIELESRNAELNKEIENLKQKIEIMRSILIDSITVK